MNEPIKATKSLNPSSVANVMGESEKVKKNFNFARFNPHSF